MQSALKKDVYHVLGVHPGSDLAAIRLAYRRLALVAHPDKGGSAKAFQTVAAAFEALSAAAVKKVSCQSKRCTGRRNLSKADGRKLRPRAPTGIVTLRPRNSAVLGKASDALPCPRIARSSVPSSRQALEHLRAVLQSMTTERRRKNIQSLAPRARTALLEFMTKVQEAKIVANSSTLALESQQYVSAGQAFAACHSSNNCALGCTTCSRQADSSETQSSGAKSIKQIDSRSMKMKDELRQGPSMHQKSTIPKLATSDDKPRFVSLSGVGGVNKIGSAFRATIHVASLELYTQLQPNLEVAIAHHGILMEIRQAIVAAVAAPDQDIVKAFQTALANAAVPEEELNLRVIVRLRARQWLGTTWVNSPVLSLQKAVHWRSRLLRARQGSWVEFRAAWIELMLERGILGPCNRRPLRSFKEAETVVDEAWLRAAAYRKRIQARQETRRAKELAEQAWRVEQQRKRQAMLRQREELRRKRQAAYQERLKSRAARQRMRDRLEEIRQERNLARATTEVLHALELEDRLKQRAEKTVLQAGRAVANKKRRHRY